MHPEECTYNITDELRKLHGRVFKAQRFIKACTLSKALTWPMQKQNAQSSRIVSECTPIELTKASARAKVVYNGSSVTCSQSPHTFSLSPPPPHTHTYTHTSTSLLAFFHNASPLGQQPSAKPVSMCCLHHHLCCHLDVRSLQLNAILKEVGKGRGG